MNFEVFRNEFRTLVKNEYYYSAVVLWAEHLHLPKVDVVVTDLIDSLLNHDKVRYLFSGEPSKFLLARYPFLKGRIKDALHKLSAQSECISHVGRINVVAYHDTGQGIPYTLTASLISDSGIIFKVPNVEEPIRTFIASINPLFAQKISESPSFYLSSLVKGNEPPIPNPQKDRSLELGAALAYYSLLTGLPIRQNIVVTGSLEEDSQIGIIDNLTEKIGAIITERPNISVICYPNGNELPNISRLRKISSVDLRRVDDFEGAVSAVFGDDSFEKARARFEQILNASYEKKYFGDEQLGFEDIIEELGMFVVGRDNEFNEVRDWIVEQKSSQQKGNFWITGVPGVGKSAFMANLVRQLQDNNSSDNIIIPYFFRKDDEHERCSIATFVRAVEITLFLRAGITTKDSKGDNHATKFSGLMKLFSARHPAKNLIFLIDGIDEIYPNAELLDIISALRTEHCSISIFSIQKSDYLNDLMNQNLGDKVTELALLRRSEHIGLILQHASFKGILKDLHPELKEKLLSQEYVNLVFIRSKGLPLYTDFLIRTIRCIGDIPPSAELPQDIGVDYIESLLSRVSGYDGFVFQRLLTVCCLAKEPLTEESISEILQLFRIDDEKIKYALDYATVFLREFKWQDEERIRRTFYHRFYRDSIMESCKNFLPEVSEKFSEWCSISVEKKNPYALRYYPIHVTEFLENELKLAGKRNEIGRICKLVLSNAVKVTKYRISPLDALRSSGINAAFGQLQFVESELEQQLWLGIFAWELLEWEDSHTKRKASRRRKAVNMVETIAKNKLFLSSPEITDCLLVILLSLLELKTNAWISILRHFKPRDQSFFCEKLIELGRLEEARFFILKLYDQRRDDKDAEKAYLRNSLLRKLAYEYSLKGRPRECQKLINEITDESLRLWVWVDIAVFWRGRGKVEKARKIIRRYIPLDKAWQHAMYEAKCASAISDVKLRNDRLIKASHIIFKKLHGLTRAKALSGLAVECLRARNNNYAKKCFDNAIGIVDYLISKSQLSKIEGAETLCYLVEIFENMAPLPEQFKNKLLATLEHALEISQVSKSAGEKGGLSAELIRIAMKFNGASFARKVLEVNSHPIARSIFRREEAMYLCANKLNYQAYLSRIPKSDILNAVAGVSKVLSAQGKTKEAREIIAKHLFRRKTDENAFRWGKPRMLGSIAVKYQKKNCSEKAQTLLNLSESLVQNEKSAWIFMKLASNAMSIDKVKSEMLFEKAIGFSYRTKEKVATAVSLFDCGLSQQAESIFKNEYSKVLKNETDRKKSSLLQEFIVPYIRTKKFEELKMVLDDIQKIRRHLAHLDQLKIASQAAYELAKGYTFLELSDLAFKSEVNQHISTLWDFCNNLKLKNPSFEKWQSNEYKGAQCLFTVINSDVRDGISRTEKIEDVREQARTYKYIARYLIRHKRFDDALQLCDKIKSNESEHIPDLAHEFIKKGRESEFEALFSRSAKYLDSAFRMIELIVEYLDVQTTELDELYEIITRDKYMV